jgi:hypothetical protein
LLLRVADEGRGFTVAPGAATGLGLVSMRERLESLNGSLSITSAPGQGTIVEAVVPLPADARIVQRPVSSALAPTPRPPTPSTAAPSAMAPRPRRSPLRSIQH